MKSGGVMRAAFCLAPSATCFADDQAGRVRPGSLGGQGELLAITTRHAEIEDQKVTKQES